MKAEFYDVKLREHVEVEIISKKKTDTGRCMIFGKTADGRSLPMFIKAADFDGKYKSVPDANAPAPAPAAEPAAPAKKRCCCKKAK